MRLRKSESIVIDIWGDFAMFTRPDSKIERVTYNFPTPSACRGILEAIYCKPVEFYYEITGIDVISPIRLVSIKKNEVKDIANVSAAKKGNYFIDTTESRTQRMNTYLRDVYYRIHADIVLQDNVDSSITISRIVDQFNRRVKNGKCFYQPYFGTRECICYFSEPDYSKQPINEDVHFGITLYDVFDIKNTIPLDTKDKKSGCKPLISFFDADMKSGHVSVPRWDSDDLFVRRV